MKLLIPRSVQYTSGFTRGSARGGPPRTRQQTALRLGHRQGDQPNENGFQFWTGQVIVGLPALRRRQARSVCENRHTTTILTGEAAALTFRGDHAVSRGRGKGALGE